MLQPIKEGLQSLRLILASGSPRRRDLLQTVVGINFEVIPSQFEENLDKSQFKHPSDYVKENSKRKALDVFISTNSKEDIPDLVIGADTVVVLEQKILEKPKDSEDAYSMLKSLSGTKHQVYSGISFVWPKRHGTGYAEKQFYECTEVEFGDLTDDVILAYIESGEPFDKAGAYGIQGKGGTLVKAIYGDFYNVVGLPLFSFCNELKHWFSEYTNP